MTLILVGMVILARLLNAVYDTPHEPESRPDAYEVCDSERSVWIEQATETSSVCDRHGVILIELR